MEEVQQFEGFRFSEPFSVPAVPLGSKGNKRAVLANVPSFRFMGSRNIKNQSSLLPGQRCRERFLGGNFGTRGTSAQTTLSETTLLRTTDGQGSTKTLHT